MLSIPPPLVAQWHFWVSLLSRQQAAVQTWRKDWAQGGNRHEQEEKKKIQETERDREGDGWSEERRHTDGHSPTDGELWGHLEDTWGSYEPIWFLLQERPSVTNGKVGAGKHISVTARHCRKNKLNSLLAFHTLSTLFSLSPSITHFVPVWFSVPVTLLLSLSSTGHRSVSTYPSVVPLPSPRHVPHIHSPLLSTVYTQKMKNRAICVGTASEVALLMFLLRQLSVSLQAAPTPALHRTCGQLASAAAPNNTVSAFWQRVLWWDWECNEASGSLCRLPTPCTMAAWAAGAEMTDKWQRGGVQNLYWKSEDCKQDDWWARVYNHTEEDTETCSFQVE